MIGDTTSIVALTGRTRNRCAPSAACTFVTLSRCHPVRAPRPPCRPPPPQSLTQRTHCHSRHLSWRPKQTPIPLSPPLPLRPASNRALEPNDSHLARPRIDQHHLARLRKARHQDNRALLSRLALDRPRLEARLVPDKVDARGLVDDERVALREGEAPCVRTGEDGSGMPRREVFASKTPTERIRAGGRDVRPFEGAVGHVEAVL